MDSIFFVLSKIAWLFIAPDSLLLFFILFVSVMLWRGKVQFAKWGLGFLCLLITVIALLPVGDWLLFPLDGRFPANPQLPDHVDGVIVLSGAENARLSAIWNQVEFGDGAERDFAFLALARRYPNAKLVFTGGSSNLLEHDRRAADIVKLMFAEQGLSIRRVIVEREARNSFENLKFSKELAKPNPHEKWILVTSAFHMPRSVGIFCKEGWPVIPYPVDHRTSPGELFRIDWGLADHLISLNIGIREWVGLIVYYVTGKTTAILPVGCV